MRIAKNHMFAELIDVEHVVFHTKMSSSAACCKVLDLRKEIGVYVTVLMLFTGTFIELPTYIVSTMSATSFQHSSGRPSMCSAGRKVAWPGGAAGGA